MALPARKQVPHDNDGNTTEPKLHTREQQMHASLPDKSLEPQSRRHASLHPVMHANANTNSHQHNQSTNSRLQSQHHQSNANTPALHASTPSQPQRLQANNSQRVALKPVERMHQPPKVSLKPASSIGNNATNKIKAEKVLHKLDENPRQLHANIPRMQPENTKLDDDLQQMDDELLGDEDVVDLEDLIDTEHTTPEYSYESDAFDMPVPDDGFDDDNESSDTDELDDALTEDSLNNANAYNDYNADNEQSDDTESDIDNNDDYIDDVSDESSDDYYDNNDDYIDDDTDSDDYLDDDSDTNEESYDDYIDDTDDELEPSLQDDTANNVNNNNTDSNASTTPDNSISEPSDPTTNDDSSDDDNESKPTASGFKAMLADFKKKIKNEIGDNNDDNADTDTDDSNEDADKKSDKQKPDENDDDQNPNDKPTIDKKSPLTLIISIITLPFRILMFTLRTASKLMRIAMSAVSMLTVFALIWLILNIPASLNKSNADFDNDEGTLTAESVKYDNDSITFTAVNNSDMIAHADITGSVKAWKPFKRIPVSLFAPVKVMDCTTSYVDMNPNESKEITIQCTGDTGLWMRPTVHITGE